MVVPAGTTTEAIGDFVPIVILAIVYAMAWVARTLIVCLTRRDGDDLPRSLDAIRPGHEFRRRFSRDSTTTEVTSATAAQPDVRAAVEQKSLADQGRTGAEPKKRRPGPE